MKSSRAIRASVTNFIKDFAKWNSQVYRRGKFDPALDWEKARERFKTSCARHFTEEGRATNEFGMQIGSPPSHTPKQEKIVSVTEISDSEVIVETVLTQSTITYYEYTVRWTGCEWLIAKIQTYYRSHVEPIKDINLKTLARSRYKVQIAKDAPSGLTDLFKGPTKLKTGEGLISTKLVSVGTIETPSEFLTADDPGNWDRGVAVFKVKVPVGRHEIELVIGDEMPIVTAARIVFKRSRTKSILACATRKFPPTQSTTDTHLIAIDGGILGLADAGAIFALTAREREILYHQLANTSRQSPNLGAASVALKDSIKAWVINTGCRDGGYYAYWQLDNKGNPLSLIFDFADLGQPVWEVLRLPVKLNKFAATVVDKGLKQFGLGIRFKPENNLPLLKVQSVKDTKTKIFNSQGEKIFDSEGCGCSVCENETTYHLGLEFPENLSGEMEVQIYHGHKYDSVE
jgi:hypothetical protein